MTVADNITARDTAAEICDLIDSLAVDVPECARTRYYEIIRNELVERYPLPKQDGPAFEPMSDEESFRFENQFTMPFGKHHGDRIGAVPMTYLQWLASEGDSAKFIRQLNRYLASPRIRAEQLS